MNLWGLECSTLARTVEPYLHWSDPGGGRGWTRRRRPGLWRQRRLQRRRPPLPRSRRRLKQVQSTKKIFLSVFFSLKYCPTLHLCVCYVVCMCLCVCLCVTLYDSVCLRRPARQVCSVVRREKIWPVENSRPQGWQGGQAGPSRHHSVALSRPCLGLAVPGGRVASVGRIDTLGARQSRVSSSEVIQRGDDQVKFVAKDGSNDNNLGRGGKMLVTILDVATRAEVTTSMVARVKARTMLMTSCLMSSYVPWNAKGWPG